MGLDMLDRAVNLGSIFRSAAVKAKQNLEEQKDERSRFDLLQQQEWRRHNRIFHCRTEGCNPSVMWCNGTASA